MIPLQLGFMLLPLQPLLALDRVVVGAQAVQLTAFQRHFPLQGVFLLLQGLRIDTQAHTSTHSICFLIQTLLNITVISGVTRFMS
jgi:hypothetical protein